MPMLEVDVRPGTSHRHGLAPDPASIISSSLPGPRPGSFETGVHADRGYIFFRAVPGVLPRVGLFETLN